MADFFVCLFVKDYQLCSTKNVFVGSKIDKYDCKLLQKKTGKLSNNN